MSLHRAARTTPSTQAEEERIAAEKAAAEAKAEQERLAAEEEARAKVGVSVRWLDLRPGLFLVHLFVSWFVLRLVDR